jgi:hypothetical protein
MDDSAKDDDDSDSSSTPEAIKVYLRLRPKTKLETMKRSKDCIELHDNPTIITVDSPLLGEYEFSFDKASLLTAGNDCSLRVKADYL